MMSVCRTDWDENKTSFRLRWNETKKDLCFACTLNKPNMGVCILSLTAVSLLFPLQIWVRNYQIIEQKAANAQEAHAAKKATGGDDSTTSLVEIGPRFVLNPIRIFRGSFGGQALYHNPDFVSPNHLRSLERQEKGQAYEMRKDAQKKRKLRNEDLVLPEDPLSSVFR